MNPENARKACRLFLLSIVARHGAWYSCLSITCGRHLPAVSEELERLTYRSHLGRHP